MATLAWVAIENGEYEQAIALTDDASRAVDVDDDLLACRGVALERNEQYAAALLVYGELAGRGLDGALGVDLLYRMGTCLRELGDAGEAAGSLDRLLSEKREERAFPVLRMRGELEQWVDSLLQFAPLEELEVALEGGALSDELAERMRSMVRCRALAVVTTRRRNGGSRWTRGDRSTTSDSIFGRGRRWIAHGGRN